MLRPWLWRALTIACVLHADMCLQTPTNASLWSASSAPTPKIHIRHLPCKGGKRYVEEFKAAFLPLMSEQVSEDSADLVLTCCMPLKTRQVEALPVRPVTSPYLVFSHGFTIDGDTAVGDKLNKFVASRPDVLYMNYDLRDHIPENDVGPPLPGVVLAPPMFYAGPPVDPQLQSKFFLTWRGSMREYAGVPQPRRAFKAMAPALYDDGTKIEFTENALADRWAGTPSQNDQLRYSELLNTSYALILRGNGRWVYRLSEVIGACAIPVFLVDGRSNGWRLPFDNLIDWSSASVQLGEKLGFDDEELLLQYLEQHPEKLKESLPKDKQTIEAMRKRVCDINREYFATEERRAHATLMSASALIAGKRTPLPQDNAVLLEDSQTANAATKTTVEEGKAIAAFLKVVRRDVGHENGHRRHAEGGADGRGDHALSAWSAAVPK